MTQHGELALLKLAEKHDLPRMVSIRGRLTYYTRKVLMLIEHCHHGGKRTLVALAGGMLSGKYSDGEIPAGSRWSYSQRNGLFRDQPEAHAAIKAYMEVARNMVIHHANWL